MNETNQQAPNDLRRLRRGSNGKVGGVCDGAANYFNIDVTLVRIATIVAIFSTGVLFAGYIAAWIIMPNPDESAQAPDTASNWHPRTDNARLLGSAAIILALVIILPSFDLFPVDVWPLALIGIGIYLLTRTVTDQEPPEEDLSSEPAETPVVEIARPTPQKEPGTPVTPVVVSILSVGLGIGLLGHLNNWWTLTLTHSFAIVMLGCGIGLLVAAFIGRAPGLIAIGLIASLGMAASVVIDPIIEDGAGERRLEIRSIDELEDDYRLGAGELILDFRELELDGTSLEINAHVTAGELTIYVPPNVDLVIEAKATLGWVGVMGYSDEGYKAARSFETDSIGGAVLVVNAKVDFGGLKVSR